MKWYSSDSSRNDMVRLRGPSHDSQARACAAAEGYVPGNSRSTHHRVGARNVFAIGHVRTITQSSISNLLCAYFFLLFPPLSSLARWLHLLPLLAVWQRP